MGRIEIISGDKIGRWRALVIHYINQRTADHSNQIDQDEILFLRKYLTRHVHANIKVQNSCPE